MAAGGAALRPHYGPVVAGRGRAGGGIGNRLRRSRRVRSKAPAYRRLLEEAALEPSAVCYVGDDLPDLPALRSCGLAVAVGDGCREARAAAHYVTRAAGGHGAVREVIELILRCQGEWDRLAGRLRGAASGGA